MSISKRNAGLLLIVALVLVVALFAVMFTTTSYAGVFPGAIDSQFVAHCAGTSCGISG
jgi:CHASE3 domain sensor protein